MPRTITTIQVDVELYNRIANLRRHVSTDLRFNERSLGLGPMLGLLIDHWQAHPPTPEWLHDRAALYPKRGRPPKHVQGSVVQPKTKDFELGHVLMEREIPGSAYRLVMCRRCNMKFTTYDHDRPPAHCPGDGRVSTLYTPKTWTKIELLAAGFAESEVAWCDQ